MERSERVRVARHRRLGRLLGPLLLVAATSLLFWRRKKPKAPAAPVEIPAGALLGRSPPDLVLRRRLAAAGAVGAGAIGLMAAERILPGLGGAAARSVGVGSPRTVPFLTVSGQVAQVPELSADPEGATPGSLWYRTDLYAFRGSTGAGYVTFSAGEAGSYNLEPSGDVTGATDTAALLALLNAGEPAFCAPGQFWFTAFTVPSISTTVIGVGSNSNGGGVYTEFTMVKKTETAFITWDTGIPVNGTRWAHLAINFSSSALDNGFVVGIAGGSDPDQAASQALFQDIRVFSQTNISNAVIVLSGVEDVHLEDIYSGSQLAADAVALEWQLNDGSGKISGGNLGPIRVSDSLSISDVVLTQVILADTQTGSGSLLNIHSVGFNGIAGSNIYLDSCTHNINITATDCDFNMEAGTPSGSGFIGGSNTGRTMVVIVGARFTTDSSIRSTNSFFGSSLTSRANAIVLLGRTDQTLAEFVGSYGTITGLIFDSSSTYWQIPFQQSTTGTGSAALGSNCPAVSPDAPTLWVEIVGPDGNIGYIPVWE